MREKLTSYTARKTQIYKSERELIVLKGLKCFKTITVNITEMYAVKQ